MQHPLNKGNVLVVLDPTDLTKSCLLNADSLIRASDTLRKLYEEAKDKSAGCVSDQDLTCLLVLSSTAAGHSFLVTKALDAPIASILPAQAENQHPPAEAAKARHANASAAKVKKEAAQGKSTTTTSAPVSRIDWPKAYLSFLCLVIGSKKIHGISKSDFGLALPQIEVIINAAFRYSMIGSLQSAFKDFSTGIRGPSLSTRPLPRRQWPASRTASYCETCICLREPSSTSWANGRRSTACQSFNAC
jgi:hypothetical protein